MATRVAVVGGYALRPGVSRNGRLYTPELIKKAVERAQTRISNGDLNVTIPDDADEAYGDHLISQRTHHDAEDDSTRIVGRVTSMSLDPDGSARFTADIADTSAGRDIASLIAPRNPADPASVEPFLKGVSIRGYWIGPVRRETHGDGRTVETGDDLEIDGLDYTASPGVHGAQIDQFTPSGAARTRRESTPGLVYSTTSPGRVLVRESVQEVHVQSTDLAETGAEEKGAPALKSGKPAAAPTPGASHYADPGYQDDKAKRYPLDTKAHARAAWSYINMPKNARMYTPAQLKRIKGRIKAALAKFGVKVDGKEHWLIEPAHQVIESELADLAEYYPGSSLAGSFCVSLSNGPVNVSVSSYSVDPADLDLVGRAAMDGACKALAAIDPDMDGDMDVPGADAEDTDHDMGAESARGPDAGELVTETDTPDPAPAAVPVSPAPSGADVVSSTEPAPAPAADTPKEEHGMSEPTPAVEPQTPAAPATPAPTTPTVPAPAEPAATPPAPAAPAAPTTPAAAATPIPVATGSIMLTGEQFQQLLGAVRAPATVGAESAAAPAQPATETTAPAAPAAPALVAETQEQMIARLVAEGVKSALPLAVQEHVRTVGVPGRKGLVVHRPASENAAATEPTVDGLNAYGVPADWPDKPLKDYTPAERKQYIQPALLAHYLGDRANS